MDRIEISYVFVSSIVFFVIEAASPTLEELTALQCNFDRPFKCLPYGVCYNADEFCHAGTVESCFPKNVTTDQLENWCKTTGQFRPELMRDPKLCALACQARFPSLNLSHAVDQLVNLKCPPNRPFKCLPDGICHGFDEYCHAGQNKSCFDVTMSGKDQQQWCLDKGQNDVTLMPDPACKFACQAKFTLLLHSVPGYADKYWRDVSIGVSVPLGIAVVVIFGLGCFLIRRSCCKEKSDDNKAPGVKHKANPQDGNTIEMKHLSPGHTDDNSLAIESILNSQAPPNGQAAPNGQTPLNGQTAPNGQTPPNVQSDPNGQDAFAGHAALNGQTALSVQETNTCFSNIIMRHKSV